MTAQIGNSPLERLERACIPLSATLGWRRARDASLAFLDLLRQRVGHDEAFQVAQRITGVPPVALLTAAEARKRLMRFGVKKSIRWLQRVAKRVASAQGRVWVNADGDWNASETSVSNPVACIEVVRCGASRRYLVKPCRENL